MKKLVYIFLLSLIFNNLYSQIGVTNSKPKIIPQVSRLGLINNWTGINNNFRYVYANNYVTTNAGFAIGDSVNSYYLALKLPNSAIDVNTRYISNYTGTGTSQDGLHVGINNGGIVGNIGTRIYDGQSSNYMFINNSSLTTNGLTSFLFGDQSNDGTFAQFSGDTKFKSNLLVDGNIGVGTPTPLYKLDVNGTLRIVGATILPTLTTIGSVTSTEISYLSGVTSSIQTQISSKANSSQLSSKASTVSNDFTGINNFPLVGLTAQPNSNIFTPSTGFILFANSSNAFSWKGANGYFRTFDDTTNNADRTYTLPNASGTFGLLESTQTWSGVNTFTGATNYFSADIASSGGGSNGTNAFPWGTVRTTNLSSEKIAERFTNSNISFYSSGNTKLATIFTNGNLLLQNGGTFTDAGYKLDVNGTLRVTGKISVSTGANASVGNSTLVAGTITVSNTSVTANSQIFVSVSNSSGTRGFLSTAKVAGTSFTITSTSNTDTSAVDWWIIN